MELEEHCGQLLGVKSPWEIASVDLKMQDPRMDIVIEYSDDQAPCPNLDTMQLYIMKPLAFAAIHTG